VGEYAGDVGEYAGESGDAGGGADAEGEYSGDVDVGE